MKDNRNQLLTLAEQRVRLLYTSAYDQAMKIAEVRNALNAATDENFTFKANPGAERKLRKILEELGIKLDNLIANGKQTLAKDGVKVAEANVLAKVAGSQKPIAERLIQAATQTTRVAQALGTEIANEKRGGVQLSPKVWKTVESSRKELEIIIQNNIIEGKGADVASREVRQYLKDPNRLFRRVKDKKTGEYKLSKAAQQYHPGQGKYRSSYMNARRLTVTEMNMATQAAESAAYASNPLIAGYEIRLSNNHTVKDPSKKGGVKPLHDICDELQGNYPATFKFTGWHPHCRCSMVPILISAEERKKLAQARAEGKDYQPKGVITDVPDNYKQWVADNMDRIENAKTLPYFLQDNGKMTEDGYQIGNFDSLDDVREKLLQLEQPIERTTFVAFDPFSPVIMQKVAEAKTRKERNAIFEGIMNDERATSLKDDNGNITGVKFYQGNRGEKSDSWPQTKQMAFELDKIGKKVCFIPEYKGDKPSADAITQFNGRWVIADFKYSSKDNYNTIATEIERSMQKQAQNFVLKLDDGNLATMEHIVAQLQRKVGKLPNFIVINQYGKVFDISRNELFSGKYKKILKGRL